MTPPRASPAPASPAPAAKAPSACGTDKDCEARLAELLKDRSFDWIKAEPTAADLATGARLVAYRSVRGDLDCRALIAGEEESQQSVLTLGRQIDMLVRAGLDVSGQVRLRALAQAVGSELAGERTRRC